MKRVRIASRGSMLALWQSNFIRSRLLELHSDLEVEIRVFKTRGDLFLDAPLAKIGGKGLFVKELEDAILRGEAHLAVHSLKDVPTSFAEGLILCGVTKRLDRRDAFVSERYASIDDLPVNGVVGTTSLRRKMQILAKRPDLIVRDLRGNVPGRIEKLKQGFFDAIVLAYAGLKRLELTETVKFVSPIPIDTMLPSMGQGILGLESANDQEVVNLVKPLIDREAEIESGVERSFVDALQGGCQVPIGVSAQLLESGEVHARAVVGLPDGSELLRDEVTGREYEKLGVELAN
ncbi:MAG: hydroxymethylbilane synthase, partial [Helicobacteraceae bacterium]|nr:hydroxymethylbilane synthase [Helicobacteraceae bacterium]